MTVETIRDGVVVSLAYTMIVDGDVVEETTADDPLDYLHGAENIVPGLEEALTGRKVGDKFSVTLAPEDAYGEYDEEDLEEVDREDLPDEIEVGMELLLEDEYGNFFEATVKQIKKDSVVLDFNPDFAGKTVTYKVEILDMREADEEEKAHGHPHSYEEDDYDMDDYDELS
ncbi:MAG: FKBP-type peptidyl-prolyl cis-trans isomerase [Chloroflexota bacterium]